MAAALSKSASASGALYSGPQKLDHRLTPISAERKYPTVSGAGHPVFASIRAVPADSCGRFLDTVPGFGHLDPHHPRKGPPRRALLSDLKTDIPSLGSGPSSAASRPLAYDLDW